MHCSTTRDWMYTSFMNDDCGLRSNTPAMFTFNVINLRNEIELSAPLTNDSCLLIFTAPVLLQKKKTIGEQIVQFELENSKSLFCSRIINIYTRRIGIEATVTYRREKDEPASAGLLMALLF